MATTIGLPEVVINFTGKGATAIERSQRGVVLIILKDTTRKSIIYHNWADVKKDDFNADNYDLLRLVFLGSPNRVLVESISSIDGDLNALLNEVRNKKFDYICMPDASALETESIATMIKEESNKKNKTLKAVLYNSVSDHECIINFSTEEITDLKGKVYSGEKFTARVTGIIAGLPLNRSLTYFDLPEIASIKESEDPDQDVRDGKLILIDDGEKIKFARGVNSLTTYTAVGDGKKEDFSKIRIIEGMHLIMNDIRDTFEEKYVGKALNSYENKQVFMSIINGVYFRQLGGEVLESAFENYVDIDMEAQRQYCILKGEDVNQMKEMEIKTYPTGSKVFLSGRVKLLDAMEDLYINISM